MDTWHKLKEENKILKGYIEKLLNDPKYYISQCIMKGSLRHIQKEIKSGKLKFNLTDKQN